LGVFTDSSGGEHTSNPLLLTPGWAVVALDLARHQRSAGVTPIRLTTAKFLHEMALPTHLTGRGVKTMQVAFVTECVNAVSGKRGRGARAAFKQIWI
jgi:hypothetical protein